MSISENFPEPTAETVLRPLAHHDGATGGDILYASFAATEDAAQVDVIDKTGEHMLWSGELDEANARALSEALAVLADRLVSARGAAPATDGAGRVVTNEYLVMTPHGPYPACGTKLTLDQAQSAAEFDGGPDLTIVHRTRTITTTPWVPIPADDGGRQP